MPKKLLTNCPVERSLELVNKKWKICILWKLQKGILRYSQLKKEMKDITEKMLIQQLKELERDKLIIKIDYKVMPLKVEYKLDTLGKKFSSSIIAISEWGIQNKTTIENILKDSSKI
ncbi:MAG: helix-turn-helix transcriptional regulator [Pelagibacterales bacterium]|jgi:DNA-binding HxlR family transcriptional regulator|nr:helix-turn-helix transcriptional regulator [Pelagibacterales bacterium]